MRHPIIGAAIVAACAAGLTSVAGAQTFITITTGGTGGSWYPMGGAIAEIFNDEVANVSATATPGGSVANVRDVNSGAADLGFTFATNFFAGIEGTGAYEGEEMDNLVAMASLFPLYYQMAVPADSDIHSVADLETADISPGQVGFGGEVLTQIVLDAYGLSYEAIEVAGGSVSFTSSGEAVNLIRDGHLDWHGSITFAPASFFMDLAASEPIRLLEIEPDVMDAILAENPGYFQTELPGGLYDGTDEPVQVLAVSTALMVRADLDEEMVYEMTRALFENTGRIADVHPAAEAITLDTALDGLDGAPLHPGAERYFREQGVLD